MCCVTHHKVQPCICCEQSHCFCMGLVDSKYCKTQQCNVYFSQECSNAEVRVTLAQTCFDQNHAYWLSGNYEVTRHFVSLSTSRIVMTIMTNLCNITSTYHQARNTNLSKQHPRMYPRQHQLLHFANRLVNITHTHAPRGKKTRRNKREHKPECNNQMRKNYLAGDSTRISTTCR
jgi:hypothetical protein